MTSTETTSPADGRTDDEHYLVRSRAEILSVLGVMAAHKVPIHVQIADRTGPIEVRLISVKPHYEELLFDATGVSNLFFVKGQDHLTATATYDYIHVRFTAEHVEAATHHSQVAFRACIPKTMTRTQRRDSARFPVPSLNPPVIRLRRTSSGQELRMRMMDISCGGVSLVLEDRGTGIAVGTRLGGCTLELPRIGAVSTDLDVVYVEKMGNPDGWFRLGCRFSNLSMTSLDRVRDYVAVLERKHLDSEAADNA